MFYAFSQFFLNRCTTFSISRKNFTICYTLASLEYAIHKKLKSINDFTIKIDALIKIFIMI